MQAVLTGKRQVFPLPRVVSGADPGVQAVSQQVTLSHPPGGRLPLLSARPAVTFSPSGRVPNYTVWRLRHMRVNSLPKAVTWQRTGRDSNPTTTGERSTVKPAFHDILATILATTSTRMSVSASWNAGFTPHRPHDAIASSYRCRLFMYIGTSRRSVVTWSLCLSVLFSRP